MNCLDFNAQYGLFVAVRPALFGVFDLGREADWAGCPCCRYELAFDVGQRGDSARFVWLNGGAALQLALCSMRKTSCGRHFLGRWSDFAAGVGLGTRFGTKFGTSRPLFGEVGSVVKRVEELEDGHIKALCYLFKFVDAGVDLSCFYFAQVRALRSNHEGKLVKRESFSFPQDSNLPSDNCSRSFCHVLSVSAVTICDGSYKTPFGKY